MKKKVLLFLFDGYCEFEISTAISMLKSTHEVITFSINKELCTSEAGLMTLPRLSVNEINIEDYESLIIPGGDLKPIVEAVELFHLVSEFNVLPKGVSLFKRVKGVAQR